MVQTVTGNLTLFNFYALIPSVLKARLLDLIYDGSVEL